MPTEETFCLNLASFDLEYGAASHPRSRLFLSGRFAVMSNEDFIARYAKTNSRRVEDRNGSLRRH